MIREFIAKLLQKYGIWAANEASYHGSYEPVVPDALRNQKD